MKVIMIIPATGMPSMLAISLSWEVACIFLPSSVRSNSRYWKTTITRAVTRTANYWGSKNRPHAESRS